MIWQSFPHILLSTAYKSGKRIILCVLMKWW
jgi:hypothetical protein